MMFKRKPRLLKDLQISEISAVDRAAAPGAKIMLRKRDRAALKAKLDRATVALAKSIGSIMADNGVTDKNAMLARTFGEYLAHVNPGASLADVAALHKIFAEPRRKNDDVAISPAGPDEGYDLDDTDDDDTGGSTPHFLAGSPDDDETTEATDGLEQAEQEFDDDDEEEQTMKSHAQLMSDVVKQYGITAFCKSVENGDVRVSEHALCKLIEEAAKRENTSFSKLFEAQDERGIVLRKAIMAARDAQFLSRTSTLSKADPGMPGRARLTPSVVGGRAARAVDNPKTALAALQELVDAQRAANPALSESEAWLRVYEHPDNRELALRERDENRPVATGW
jgi:hypothetical protein